MSPPPLLVTLKSIIERSYGMPCVVEDLGPFIVGDVGFQTLYAGPTGGGCPSGDGARLLVREGGAMVRAAIYYPDALVRHLETFNPLVALGDENIDAFAVLVEELDHLLTLASRVVEGRPVSLLELEHHANVTKYLTVLHFLWKQRGRRRLEEPLRIWVRHHLFEKYAREEGEEEARYRDAAHLARKYVHYLESMPENERRWELRAFQRRPFSETFLLLVHWN